MKKIQRSALVAFSAKKMYDLVDDISSYHLFVPYCQSSNILQRNNNEVTAELVVSKSGIAKSFTTKNQLTPHQSIKMSLVDGPFSHLSGNWQFTALSDSACKIELYVEFDFSNKLKTLAFSKIFNLLVESMVKAFTDRAQKIYG